MELRKYLFDKKITTTEFANRLGISRVHMSGIVNGKRRPGKTLIDQIKLMTNGKVTEKDLKIKTLRKSKEREVV